MIDTEQPPTEVGGFTRVAGDWKSTHYAPRVGNAVASQIAWSSKTQRSCKAEADRLEAGGFNLVIDSKQRSLPIKVFKALPSGSCEYLQINYFG